MSEQYIRNQKRWRAILQSRAVRALFLAPPRAQATAENGEPEPAAAIAERLFFGPDGVLTRDAQSVLADLRDFCFAQATIFATDPLLMARRAGRREVWLRLMDFLNLDEKQVQMLMEVDDGL